MKLILFSGGVESTALLTMSKKEDLILICECPREDYVKNDVNWDNCRKIVNYFGNESIEFKFPTTIKGTKWVHQINWFIFISHLIAESRGDISEVWWGMHHDESHKIKTHTIERRRILEKCMTAWRVLQPKIKFQIPLEFMPKKQQWNLIPEEIKPLVNSCLYGNKCGNCNKCEEVKTLVGI